MRICFLTPTLRLFGGNLVMLQHGGFLASRGHRVTILAPESPVQCAIPPGVEVVFYRKPRVPKVDFYSFLAPYVGPVCRHLARGYDVVVPVFTPYVPHALLARRYQTQDFKLVLLFQDYFEMHWIGRYIRFLASQGWLMKRIDQIIAVSPGSAREFARASGRQPIVVVNGVDELFFERSVLPPKEDYVLFVGRPGKNKGFDVFQRAAGSFRNGKPRLRAVLASHDVECGRIGDVETVKLRSREELRQLYARAIAYVHAAPGESFGLPPLEAMACGTATVVTRTAGTQDYAVDRHNCRLVNYGDHEAMARHILDLAEDRELRSTLERNGLETAESYRWGRSLAQFEGELLRLTSGKPGFVAGSGS